MYIPSIYIYMYIYIYDYQPQDTINIHWCILVLYIRQAYCLPPQDAEVMTLGKKFGRHV